MRFRSRHGIVPGRPHFGKTNGTWLAQGCLACADDEVALKMKPVIAIRSVILTATADLLLHFLEQGQECLRDRSRSIYFQVA